MLEGEFFSKIGLLMTVNLKLLALIFNKELYSDTTSS